MKIQPTNIIRKAELNSLKNKNEDFTMMLEKVTDKGTEWVEHQFKTFNDQLIIFKQKYTDNPLKGGKPIGQVEICM